MQTVPAAAMLLYRANRSHRPDGAHRPGRRPNGSDGSDRSDRLHWSNRSDRRYRCHRDCRGYRSYRAYRPDRSGFLRKCKILLNMAEPVSETEYNADTAALVYLDMVY